MGMVADRRAFLTAVLAAPFARVHATRALFYEYRQVGQPARFSPALARLRASLPLAAIYEDRRELDRESGVPPAAGCYLFGARGTLHVDSQGRRTFFPAAVTNPKTL